MQLEKLQARFCFRIGVLMLFFITSCLAVSARGGGVAPQPSIFESPLALTLLLIILILLLVIGLLANVLRGSMDIWLERKKQQQAGTAKNIALTLILVLVTSAASFAKDTDNTVTTASQSLPPTVFMFMVGVIGLELVVIFGLLFSIKSLLGIESKKKPALIKKTIPVKKTVSFWEKFNRLRPIEKEYEIEMDHSYDGIKELNNKLPPWWLYGFFASIIFAVVYLWRFEVAHTAPSSLQEYAAAVKEADLLKVAYLAHAANNIDETTVVELKDGQDINAGKDIFQSSCAPCHGKLGEGVVGPNLTDDYWLHGGDIKDVFKTIKYGVAEKGMRSWKDEFSPKQLAQIASYIKSLRGTNPPNSKEKQGELVTTGKPMANN